VRADQLLVGRGLAESRSRAQALIMAGLVFSGERKL
jgi:23S rRNA (cytidine1920-2'-O)/16S rRNA (cytidine1409-2'-O)-methyltransferase